MRQLFLASTYFQVVCLSAGIEAGEYDRTPTLTVGGEPVDLVPYTPADERVLVLSDNAQVVEFARDLREAPGLGPALSSFDRVVKLNDVVAPNHPSSWRPEDRDLPVLERLLRAHWELGDDEVELVLESPQVNPAIALARIFHDALIRIHSDGLMSYGPTRNVVPLGNGQRTTVLHHLPLVDGVRPRLLDEYGIEPWPLDPDHFRAAVARVAEAIPDELAPLAGLDAGSTALAVGQYLAALGLLSPTEEDDLHREMIARAAEAGMRTVVFKPHPAAPPASRTVLERAAADHGVDLLVLDTPAIAEAVLHVLRPALVVGGFSTLLATARAFYEVPARAVGTDLVLERIVPFQNSNRIPATLIGEIADGTTDPIDADRARDLQALVDAVGYAMLPEVVPHFRDRAEEYLRTALDTDRMRYFRRRRLQALDLPGAPRPRGVKGRLRAGAVEAYRTARFVRHGIRVDRRKPQE
ncbi:polysialyltransferase family glycosyltransferase [Brevibacterium litoralis]|uniref:polysialyltransferase family glycosyltransferase n=1 Tax=Brevibacterium litoralis TaxID=3138935 RepID=UPI0032EEE859